MLRLSSKLRAPQGAAVRLARRATGFALALSLGGLAGCGDGGAVGGVGRGVLVIAIDGLRADHLSVPGYDYDRETTPELAELAQRGAVFTQTMSTAPDLIPAHISLLTGCDPNIALRSLDLSLPTEQRWNVPRCAPSLAVEFLAAGYSTLALADHADFAPAYGLDSGFQRFQVFDPHLDHLPNETGLGGLRPPLEQWLRERDGDEPWFAYLHTGDLERNWRKPVDGGEWDTYFAPRRELDVVPPVAHTDPAFFAVPRSRWRGGNTRLGFYEARYDGALRYVDAQIAGLLNTLEELGRLEHTTIVVVGSFGVQFGEDALWLDHGRYTVADLGVPWILVPGEGGDLVPTRDVLVDGVVSLADVAPTLLEMHGLPVPGGTHGRSQLPALRSGHSTREYALASCGLQQGVVAFDDRHALEILLPGTAASLELGLSWYGEGAQHADLEERFYDRLSNPFPSLSEPLPPPGERAVPLREWALQWASSVDLARRVMQESTQLHSPVAPEEKAALQASGYLGSDC